MRGTSAGIGIAVAGAAVAVAGFLGAVLGSPGSTVLFGAGQLVFLIGLVWYLRASGRLRSLRRLGARPARGASPPVGCPRCGRPVLWNPREDRWFCPTCGPVR